MTDWHTEDLFEQVAPDATDIVFPVSRLVVDPERFERDADEPMAAVGMGVIYEKTATGGPLRASLSEAERSDLLEAYYRPHHRRLFGAVSQALSKSDRCLVLDGHSFPAIALPYEARSSQPRPEICIGTDSFHTPAALTSAAVTAFERAGFSVAVNHPYSGALVPMEFYGVDKRIMAIMVEVRRDLYMDEATGEASVNYAELRRVVRSCIRRFAGHMR